MATIHDVAKRAGCSIATVSRALNGAANLSDDLRLRVDAAVEALGYRPSQLGRGLRTKSTRTIGVLIPSLTNQVFATSVAGIEEAARERGHDIVLSVSDYDRDREPEAVRTLLARAVEGLILTVADAANSTVLDEIDAQKLPYVLLFNEPMVPGRASVSVDNTSASRELVGEMISLGHERIAFVAGRFRGSDRSRLRHLGYRAGMEKAGLDPLDVVEVPFNGSDGDVDAALAPLLASPLRPTALACSNDLLAIAVMAAVRRAGLAIPGDVSVTGFDGIAIGRQIDPTLATLEQPTRDMGRAALSMLLDLKAGKAQPALTRLAHRFRPGGSLAAAPGGMAGVSRASPANISST